MNNLEAKEQTYGEKVIDKVLFLQELTKLSKKYNVVITEAFFYNNDGSNKGSHYAIKKINAQDVFNFYWK